MDNRKLENIANRIRLQSLEMAVAKNRGHLGSTYSCVDILVALYYGGILRYSAADPLWPNRDRFILSKGHACLALYAILVDLGFMKQEVFDTYGEDGGLGGQVDISIPGVDWNTGSLGHALGVCAGIALASKMDKRPYRAFTVIGDAECDEGSVWEAIAFASDHNLDNLVCIVDRNRLSVTGILEDTAVFRHLPNVLTSMGWTCLEMDGHSFDSMLSTIRAACGTSRPAFIIANTVKGKGVSFMENNPNWHYGVPSDRELEIARHDLG